MGNSLLNFNRSIEEKGSKSLLSDVLSTRKGTSKAYGIVYLFMTIVFTLIGTAVSAQCTDPTPEILGDFSVCGGEIVTYSVDTFTLGNAYDYALDGGGTIVSVADGDVTIQFDEDEGGPFILTLTESIDTCAGSTFALINIEGDAVLVCNDNLNISLASSCTLELTPDIILENPQFPDDSYEISVVDEDGNEIGNMLDVTHLDQTLEVTVTHICTGNKCWGDIILEDKLAPEIMCENDTLTCDEFAFFSPTQPELTLDNCGDVTFTSTTSDEEQPCGSPYSLIRSITWIATDGSGNESDPCTQMIFVERVELDDLTFPGNFDGLPGNSPSLSCSGNFATTDEGFPALSVTGSPGGDAGCSTIEFTFTDTSIPLCDDQCEYSNSSYKVIRNFVAVDWCTGMVREETQILKVEDTTDPVIASIADITMSVNPFDCSAQVPLPLASVSDNCTATESVTYTYSSEEGTIVNGVLFLEAPAKTMGGDGVEVTVTAADCCGNTAERTFQVFLTDDTPPVVVADSHETISLLPTESATMYATSLDDGSYDNCGPIEITVKRMDNGGGLPPIDLFPPSGNDNAQYNEVVHFYCEDISETDPVMVQLRVCDDAGMDGIFGNTNDNCNLAMVEVTVQNKYAPIVQCPPNMVISCTDFEGVDINDNAQMNELFGEAIVVGPCSPSLDVSANASTSLNCGEGFITRTFTSSTSGGTSTCTQTISVEAFENNLLTCDRISFDQLSSIYNWCAVNDGINNNNDDLPAIDVNGCEGINIAEVIVNTAGLCTTVGVQTEIDTFNYAGSTACKKYIVHYEVIDQCVFDENYVNQSTGQIDPFHSDNGYFEFYLEYNVVDNDPPVLTCADITLAATSCEGSSEIVSIIAMDVCTPDELLQFEYRVDVGANGSVDLPLGGGYFEGNAFSGSALGLSAIPPGDHILLWRVDDGCGNMETCSQSITVEEFDKAPTPYCIGGLSTAVMNTNGSVAIWASDFDNGSQDDCGSPLTFTMIRNADAENSSDPHADATPSLTFDCDDIVNGVSEVIELRIYVTDETGAYDYCSVTLKVEDNEADICPDNISTSMLSGEIVTETGFGFKEAVVNVNSSQAEYPKSTMTNDEGEYSFDVFSLNDYNLTAVENSDYLQGITTVDILLIQKHILGLQSLESPYKKIAADVNNDCKISGSDIIQVRKLLLGYYTNDILPANSSWRFINEEETFDNAIQPCNFSEEINVTQLVNNSINNNFVAVKVADVSGTTSNGLQSDEISNRSNNSLDLVVDNVRYSAGEVVKIPVYSSNVSDLKGLQFTLSIQGFMINGIEKGALKIGRENANMNLGEYGIMSVSFDEIDGVFTDEDEVLFTVLATAKSDDELRGNISITSDGLIAESYFGEDLTIESVTINLRDGGSIYEVENAFTLLQNHPNPFSELTNIRFELPRAGIANLKIYDIQGRLIYAKSGEYNKGYNTITISKEDLKITGELIYQVEFEGNIDTRRMILVN